MTSIIPCGIGWGFDCPGTDVLRLTATEPTAIWPYISGDDGIAWTSGQIRGFSLKNTTVYRVNQGFKQGVADAFNGDEFDVEAGAWKMGQIAEIVAARRRFKWSTRIYCTWASYGAIKQMLAEQGTGQSVWFRIADWNLNQHLAQLALHDDIYAGQWATPATSPAVTVPGTALTLAEANADLSVVLREYTGWVG
jgi:hypothetical protein